MLNNNEIKYTNIINGDVLLSIESKYSKVNKMYVFISNLLIIAFFSLSIIHMNYLYRDYLITASYSYLLLVFYVVILLCSFYYINRGNPLIITTNGIIMKPYVNEYWEDIKGFNFVNYIHGSRLTLNNTGSGVSLIIYNKGKTQRSVNLRGHSIIATNGIFLNKENVALMETIFSQHNIDKGNFCDG